MKKLLILGAVLMSVPFVSFAQTTSTTSVTQATGTITVTTTITNPGLLPGDFFYFLDRWTEALNMALTFNNENKARKHLKNAKERVAEMDEVLKDPTAKLDDVKSAKDDLDVEIADATTLVKGEKDKGNDVSDLARELDDELDSVRDALKDIFKEHKNESSRAENEIRSKLAALAPGDPQIPGLTQALESIMKEKNDADKEDNDIDGDFKDEQKLFEDIMGKEMSAEKHMEQAKRLRDRMEQGLPEGLSTSSDKLMKAAEEAMKRGDFESAKRMSSEAENALEKIRETMGGLQMGMPSQDGDGIDEMDVNNLEQEIQKGEKMMEGLR